jgi:hypothetical protein
MNRKPKCANCPNVNKSGVACSAAVSSSEQSAAYMAESGKGIAEELLPCQWFINSSEYNYCFWEFNKELHGNPMTDKEICKLLGLTVTQVKEAYSSAIQKLQEDKDSDEILELLEAVMDAAGNSKEDDTVYLPDSFREKIEDAAKKNELADAEDAEPKEPRTERRGRKPGFGLGMPIHRSGKRTDLYSLGKKPTGKKK